VRFGVVSMTVCSASSEGPPAVRNRSPEFSHCLCSSDRGAHPVSGGERAREAVAGRAQEWAAPLELGRAGGSAGPVVPFYFV
jgi:hypothetical protein